VVSEEWSADFVPPHEAARGKYSSNGPGTTCALMLHRMVSVRDKVLKTPNVPKFDVRSTGIQKDLMTFYSDTPIDLKLRLSPSLHNRLKENRLDDAQEMYQEKGSWILECQLLDTQGLRLFLLSNAADIEVLTPPQLRAHMRETLEAALKMY
jgi:predicted DNA-binding transcriptional regulator YafY